MKNEKSFQNSYQITAVFNMTLHHFENNKNDIKEKNVCSLIIFQYKRFS